jgi:hypothetical protein
MARMTPETKARRAVARKLNAFAAMIAKYAANEVDFDAFIKAKNAAYSAIDRAACYFDTNEALDELSAINSGINAAEQARRTVRDDARNDAIAALNDEIREARKAYSWMTC